MLMTDERLTSRPERPYKTPVPQVSPDLLREAVARRVSGDVTPAIIELCGYLDTYIAGKYLIRYPSRSEAILLVFKGKNSSEIGGILQELPRTIRKWREHFFAQASEYMQRQHARRRLSIWDETYCDLTHRSGGGDGSTPPIGRENFSARNCPFCAARAEHRLTCQDDQCTECRG